MRDDDYGSPSEEDREIRGKTGCIGVYVVIVIPIVIRMTYALFEKF